MSEQFGPYELHERLGQGAMGIVYRARDTQLDRWVAIKILNAVAVADGERLQRFVQEAKVTSSLSHPSITTIHQLSESDARHYIVMELVAGENLRQRLRHGALEIPAVLDLGIQAADGLAAAHAAGIIHRDLKPENMMLRPDGLLKILDFGLAKLVQAHEPGDLFGSDRTSDETILHSPPAASSPTVPGMVLGTVGYMAPEQVRGGLVDHRSDLFALGCVLYELATGTRAWSRESPIETMHAILKEPVRPLHEVRPDAPAELERILRKTLAKDPAERYQNARDLAVDLRALRRDLEMVASGATRALHSGSQPAIQSPPRPRRWMRGVIAVAAIIAAAGIAFVLRSVRRDAVTPPGALQITRLTSTGNADWPVLTPDGRFVAYVRNDMGSYSIWLRQIATNSESQLIPASERPLGALVFSPDSNWLYYISVDRTTFETPLYRMPVVGGEARLVCDDVDTPISFSPDGKEFVFSRVLPPLASEVYISPADGATPPRRIVERGPDFLSLATWSPDGREIVAAALDTRDVSRVRFAHFTPNGGKVTIDESPVWAGMRGITWIPDGSGYYVAGLLTAQDPTGRVYRVRRRGGVQPITTDLNSYASVSVSADGKFLVSLRSSTTTNFWTMPVTGDASRDADAAAQIGFGTARIDNPTPSPDGRVIAYSSDAAGATDLWRMNIDGSDARALTSGPASELQPDWSPDGRRLAYTLLDGDSVRVWVINADGTGARQVVFGVQSGAADWGPDSRTIVYHQTRDARSNLWTLDVDAPGATPVRLNEELASFPQWSPDGREILCYTFDGDSATAKPAVAIVPVTGGPSRRIPVPFDSDTMARAWSPDGQHITSIRLSEGASNLVEYSITDGTMRPLSQFGGGLRIYAFTWLPGGSGVVLERGTSNRDVVLLQNF